MVGGLCGLAADLVADLGEGAGLRRRLSRRDRPVFTGRCRFLFWSIVVGEFKQSL